MTIYSSQLRTVLITGEDIPNWMTTTFNIRWINGRSSNFRLLDRELAYHKIVRLIERHTFHRCDSCGCYFNVELHHLNLDAGIEFDSDNLYCAYCIEHRCGICDNCGALYDAQGDHCHNCYNNCSRCGRTTYINELDENDYCERCANRCECSECGDSFDNEDELSEHMDEYHSGVEINSYGYKPSPNFHRLSNETVTRYFGVELEFEFNGKSRKGLECLDTSEDYYYLKHDGSLNDGCELVTHPMTRKYWYKFDALKKSLDCLRDYGYRSHDTSTCGLHIHVSKESAHIGVWAKVALFWYTHKDFIAQVCRRENGHYCQSKQVSIHDDTNKITRSYTRYEAINFENDATVEFRQFKGTLIYETVIASIGFLDLLIKYTSKKHARDIIASTTVQDFIEYVKKHDRKVYTYIQERIN